MPINRSIRFPIIAMINLRNVAVDCGIENSSIETINSKTKRIVVLELKLSLLIMDRFFLHAHLGGRNSFIHVFFVLFCCIYKRKKHIENGIKMAKDDNS